MFLTCKKDAKCIRQPSSEVVVQVSGQYCCCFLKFPQQQQYCPDTLTTNSGDG